MMKKKIISASLLLALVALCSVPNAYAYFTTYADADGSKDITLGNDTDIDETVDDLTKHIVITNNEDSQPVYIRVKLFWADEFNVSGVNVQPVEEGAWTQGNDGFWYYRDIVEEGQSTSELAASIQLKGEEKKDFNVVVVSESTPVVYENNEPRPMDWDLN